MIGTDQTNRRSSDGLHRSVSKLLTPAPASSEVQHQAVKKFLTQTVLGCNRWWICHCTICLYNQPQSSSHSFNTIHWISFYKLYSYTNAVTYLITMIMLYNVICYTANRCWVPKFGYIRSIIKWSHSTSQHSCCVLYSDFSAH